MRSEKNPVFVAHFLQFFPGCLIGWFSPLAAILHLFQFRNLSSPSQMPVDSDAQMWQATELSVPLTSREPGAAPASSGSSHPSLCHWKAPHGAWAGKGQQSVVWQAQGSTQSLSQLLHLGRSTGLPGSPAAPTGTMSALGMRRFPRQLPAEVACSTSQKGVAGGRETS